VCRSHPGAAPLRCSSGAKAWRTIGIGIGIDSDSDTDADTETGFAARKTRWRHFGAGVLEGDSVVIIRIRQGREQRG
jgi:hypothetical protein